MPANGLIAYIFSVLRLPETVTQQQAAAKVATQDLEVPQCYLM